MWKSGTNTIETKQKNFWKKFIDQTSIIMGDSHVKINVTKSKIKITQNVIMWKS